MRISLPIETKNSEAEFIPAGDRIVNKDAVAIEERWLELPDGRMRYLKAGSGPPLILIHGLMGYAFSWRFAIPALAAHATVYAIDNLGAGLSTAVEGIDCSMRATAERVLQFADALGIADFDLLGTSHGGGVAIMVAAACEEEREERTAKKHEERISRRVKRLILVAPVNPWSPHGKRLAPFLGSAFGSMLFRNTIERWRSLDYLWLRRMFGDKSKIPPDSLQGYRIPALQNHALRHGTRIVKNWTADLAQLENALPRISHHPALLMWGARDSAVDFRSAEPLRQNFRTASLITFEGVGHLPYEEAPEAFNQALIDYLTGSLSSERRELRADS